MKDFTLYEREDRPNSGLWFRFTFRGTAYKRCVETYDRKEGQRKAKALYTEITEKIKRGEADQLHTTTLRQPTSGTIADLIEAYRGSEITAEQPEARFAPAPSDASAKVRKANCFALLRFVSRDDHVSQLTPTAAHKYFADVAAKALAEPDQQQAASLRRTANSLWRQARSLFTPKCIAHYKALKLYHPAMLEFVQAGDSSKFSGRSLPKIQYNPPREQVIEATLKAWRELADHDRNLYLAIGHELSFGLRAGEMMQAQWGWHTTRNGFHCIDNSATVKGGTGWIQVKALDPFYTEMMIQVELHGWRGEPEDFIIEGTKTMRTDGIFRAVTEFLRRHGWETKKTNHALRAYAGGLVAMRFGIYECQQFLRHSTVKVTESHYTHFVTKFKTDNLDDMPAKWAIAGKVVPKTLGTTLGTTRGLAGANLDRPTPEPDRTVIHN